MRSKSLLTGLFTVTRKLKIFGVFFYEPENGEEIPDRWWANYGSVYLTNQPHRKIKAQWNIYDALSYIGGEFDLPYEPRSFDLYTYEGDER